MKKNWHFPWKKKKKNISIRQTLRTTNPTGEFDFCFPCNSSEYVWFNLLQLLRGTSTRKFAVWQGTQNQFWGSPRKKILYNSVKGRELVQFFSRQKEYLYCSFCLQWRLVKKHVMNLNDWWISKEWRVSQTLSFYKWKDDPTEIKDLYSYEPS